MSGHEKAGGAPSVTWAGGVSLEQALIASTSALICVIGEGGRIMLFNAALETATGWASSEVEGRAFWDVLVVAHDVEPAKDAIARALATGEAPPQEGDWLDRWGGHCRVAMQNSVLWDTDGRPAALVCVGVDVSAQRAAEAQLRERANNDVLTGLRNREALLVALDDEVSDVTSPGSVVMFADLDGFKAANDTHGHDIGDLLLREVADRLLAATRSEDVVARFGGDEFVVLCRRTTPAQGAAIGRRINAAIALPFTTPHGLVHLGISVGAAVGTRGDSPDQLLAAADRHMYGIKTRRKSLSR